MPSKTRKAAFPPFLQSTPVFLPLKELEIQFSHVADRTQQQAKIDALNKSSYDERHHDPELSVKLAEEALALSEKINYARGKAGALNNISFADMQKTRHEEALRKALESLGLFNEIGDEEGISAAQYNVGTVNIRMGNFDAAIEAIHKSLEWREKVNDLHGQATCFFQLSYLNETFGDLEAALDYSSRSLALREQIGDQVGKAAVLMQKGAIYIRLKNFDEARKLIGESLRLRKPEDEIRGYFASLLRWTELHAETGEYEQAKKFVEEGLAIATRENEAFGVMRFLQMSGKIAALMKNCDEALRFYHDALVLSEKMSFKGVMYEIHQSLAAVYEEQGVYEKALYHYQLFHSLKEEVLSNQSNLRLKGAKLMNDIASAKREADLERTKNEELQSAYEVIEEKNKDILDSIHYAKRIQQSLLPTEKYIERCLKKK